MSGEAAARLNLLVAYPYVTPQLLAIVARMGDRVRLVIDSGAFTAYASGKPITLDGYCGFLADLPVTLWRYFALDVIGDQAASRANYYTMRERGLTPIPVVTRAGREAFDLADEYWRSTDIVAFGGLAGTAHAFDRRPYVKAVLEHAAGRDLHLLGFSSLDWIAHYRPYMADSGSWSSADRYGWLWLYAGQGRWERLHKKDFTQDDGFSERHVAIARSLGFDLHVLKHETAWHGDNGASRWISCASWLRLSCEVERRFGTKLFIALASNPELVEQCFYAQLGEIDGETARQQRMAATA
jgi:hypothetical protein